MINGLDYSMGMPDIVAMQQGKVAFVCRYVGWSDLAQTKILTAAEAQILSQNGIAIVSNYEWYSTRPQEGAAAADVDAARALQIHESCGGPSSAPIYFSVDYDSPGSDVADYFRELANKIGIQRVGAYGSYECIKYLFDNGLITWGWQTYAWSAGQWDSRAQIRQTQNGVQFGGIEVDFDTGLVDNIGQWKVGTPVSIPLTPKGEVAVFVDVSQMEPNESEMACGFFAAAEVRCARQVGQQPGCTPEQLDQWADSQGGANTEGVSIEDMHNLFKAAGLHYWDIGAIAPGSAQSNDIAEIKAALQQGYPVVVTVIESSIYDMDLGGNPYAPNWTPSGNHVLVATGIASDGNLLYHDTAAISGGIFGKIQPQPRRYRNSTTAHTWASIVQLPWLPAIQSGNPLSWAPIQAGGQPPVTTTEQEANFEAEWKAVLADVSTTSGLANFARSEYMAGRPHGAALSHEFPLSCQGVACVGQMVNNGVLIWKSGVASFNAYK